MPRDPGRGRVAVLGDHRARPGREPVQADVAAGRSSGAVIAEHELQAVPSTGQLNADTARRGTLFDVLDAFSSYSIRQSLTGRGQASRWLAPKSPSMPVRAWSRAESAEIVFGRPSTSRISGYSSKISSWRRITVAWSAVPEPGRWSQHADAGGREGRSLVAGQVSAMSTSPPRKVGVQTSVSPRGALALAWKAMHLGPLSAPLVTFTGWKRGQERMDVTMCLIPFPSSRTKLKGLKLTSRSPWFAISTLMVT